jgi:selenocysteine lyase/cysteine desulfurase
MGAPGVATIGEELRRAIVGVECRVPVAGGEREFINLDHAASTPPFVAVLAAVNALAPWYANVHRGAGFKARLSSTAFEAAREEIHQFIGADQHDDVTLFTRNTTEGVNHLAATLEFGPESVVLVSGMEHHSNDLPWRRVARVIHVDLTPDGAIDEADLQGKLHHWRGKVRLLAVTGASNVTGLVNPVHRYARWTHAAGAEILVDAAQLAAHRPIRMHQGPAAEHLDYVVFSGHKLYAPFGVGVLAGPRRRLTGKTPYQVGGGTVDLVDRELVSWTTLPDREEGGTPCVLGAVALAAATREYHRLGWDAIKDQEHRLTRHAWQALAQIPGLTLYALSPGDRLGVIAFNLEGKPHALLAAILSHEWGIGSRSGCFCAHPYLQHLLEIDDARMAGIRAEMASGDRSGVPGAVRVSFGLGTPLDEVDTLVTALSEVARGRHRHDYLIDRATGDCLPRGTSAPDYSRFLAGPHG